MTEKIIVVGEYGSGKTEFALNLAVQKAVEEKVILVDLDIVNPYFRSREAKAQLADKDIEFVFNQRLQNADLPALSPRVDAALTQPGSVIIDVGGDDGSVVLGRYRERLLRAGAEVWQVVNCSRPFTSTAAGIVEAAARIEAKSGLRVNALINNTNLGRETTANDVIEGAKIIAEAAASLKLPVLWHCARPEILPELSTHLEQLFSMDISLFPAYLS
ncbi:MAG: hypothetical protein FH749_05150 [Firmicutes bacterium]|nr:hypothetical protein [Bacillota bacterium]